MITHFCIGSTKIFTCTNNWRSTGRFPVSISYRHQWPVPALSSPSQPSNMISHHLVELAVEVRNLQVLRRNCRGTMEKHVDHRYQEAIRSTHACAMDGVQPNVPPFYSTCQASWDGWTSWSYNHFSIFLLQNHRYMSSDWVVWSRHQVVHCQPINLVGATGNRNIHSRQEMTASWLQRTPPTLEIGWSPVPHSTSSIRPGSYSRIAQSGTVLKPRETWTWGDSSELAAGAGKLLPMANHWAGFGPRSYTSHHWVRKC